MADLDEMPLPQGDEDDVADPAAQAPPPAANHAAQPPQQQAPMAANQTVQPPTQHAPPPVANQAVQSPQQQTPSTGVSPDIITLMTRLLEQTIANTSKPDAASASVAKHLEETRLLSSQPWRAAFTEFQRHLKIGLEQDTEHMTKAAIHQCKSSIASPIAVMVLCYLLWGNADAHRAFVVMILQAAATDGNLVRLHNYYVAQQAGEVFIDHYGKYLDGLTWPLFPNVDELSGLNVKLMGEYAKSRSSLSGGAADFVPSVYSKSCRDVVGGAYILPVVETPYGTGVDVQEAVDASHHQSHRIDVLDRKLQRMEKENQELRRQLQAARGSDAKPKGSQSPGSKQSRKRKTPPFGGGDSADRQREEQDF